MGQAVGARVQRTRVSHLSSALPQPLVACTTTLLALVYATAAWSTYGLAGSMWPWPQTGMVCTGLLACLIASYQFPIHIQRSTKIYLSTTPLFLLAVLLPPPLAAIVGGMGILAGERLIQARRRNLTSSVITAGTRLVPAALIGSLVAHWGMPGHGGPAGAIPLAAAAVAMLSVDLLSVPLMIAPLVQQRPLQVLRGLIGHGLEAEGMQYLLGIAGALAMVRTPLALIGLVAPLVVLYSLCKQRYEVHQRTRRLLEELADTVDARDPYTGGHSRRVAQLARAMLQQMGLGGPEAALIVEAARVHDVGKLHIPESILRKPGPLSAAERDLMKAHPERGAAVLRDSPGFARGVGIVRHHHEAWDGSGYPAGLRGEEIPLGARVIAVADSYDAMTSDRPYRRGMSPAEATSRLRAGRGTQWDPALVDALLAALPALTPVRVLPALDDPQPIPMPVLAQASAG